MGVLAHDFAGQRVLVTGGTRGVGLAVAQAFVESGAQVTVTGTKVLPGLYDADLSRFDYHQLQLARRESIDYFLSNLGGIDILINAAGATLPHSADPHEREFVAHSARIGLVGPTRLTTRLRFRLSESLAPGGGAVVNTGAVRSWLELTAPRAEAQAELVASTKRFGESWSRHGARVNTVLDTAPLAVPQQFRVQISHQTGPLLTRPAQVRVATHRDVAGVVLFLAGSSAAYVTGQTIVVNGSVRG